MTHSKAKRSAGTKRKQPKSAARPRSRRRRDADAPSPDAIDWDSEVFVDVDPELIEEVRARRALKSITLRVGEEQIAEARRVAARTGVPYQTVLRRWLAQGASRSRSVRKTG